MHQKEVARSEELQEKRAALALEYELAEHHYDFGGRPFIFLSVLDSYALLDRISPEEFVKDEQMPYWAEIWPSAITLSTFLSGERPLQGLRALELGAGVGMVSVVAASKGASVYATDYSLEALRFIQYNALKNGVDLEIARLDWRQVECPEKFDLLFAADVLYERVNLLPIVYAIDKLLKPEGEAYIADPRRRMAAQFVELAEENGFTVVPFAREYRGGTQAVSVNIYRITRKGAEGR